MKTIKVKLAALIVFCAFACALAAGTVTAVSAADYSGYRVILDKTYLKKAVVSEVPVELTVDIRNAKSQRVYDEIAVEYSITAGGTVAEISGGNKLTVKSAGSFTVRAALADAPAVFEEYTGTAYSVTFSNLEFTNSFEKVTVYTQPIHLQISVDIDGIVVPEDAHSEVNYSVISGPAELFCEEFLRITGKGTVVIKASSRYVPSISIQKEFNVTDPEENDVVTDLDDVLEGSGGSPSGGDCSGSSAIGAVFARAALCFVALKLKK